MDNLAIDQRGQQTRVPSQVQVNKGDVVLDNGFVWYDAGFTARKNITELKPNGDVLSNGFVVPDTSSDADLTARKNIIKLKPAKIALEFRNQVSKIWYDCIAHGSKPWLKKENVIGEALNNDFTFDPKKLMEHKEEIYELLLRIHNATTYEEMKFLDTGEKWSELRQPVSQLMALGNALNLIDFKYSRLDWDEDQSKNPEIAFKL